MTLCLMILNRNIEQLLSDDWILNIDGPGIVVSVGDTGKKEEKKTVETLIWKRNLEIIFFYPRRTRSNCRILVEQASARKKVWDTHKAGASQRIENVPKSDAVVKSHKNKRSNTMATNPQSWSSCKNIFSKERKARERRLWELLHLQLFYVLCWKKNISQARKGGIQVLSFHPQQLAYCKLLNTLPPRKSFAQHNNSN